MDVITHTLLAAPLILAAGSFLILFIWWGVLVLARGGRHLVDGAGFVIAAVALFTLWVFVAILWTQDHHRTLEAEGLREFQSTYQMTLVDGDLPVGTIPRTVPITAFLHDQAGLKACLVEVTPGATYRVFCDSTEILP